MQRSSNSWPVVVALLALIGFAVARHTSDRQQFQPNRPSTPSRLCQVNGRPCNSVERLRSIRGLQLDQR
ncbi:hypothetical protein NZK27_02710 [Synechococcus sp. FGCU-3]|jgi:hypothetical protein|nr:hypothetical protein [Synechococcus sp. FGCU3]